MKLSEEIMLGSLILAPKRHTFNDGEGHGCAIGMANAAVGFKNPIPREHDGLRSEFECRTFLRRHAWAEILIQACPERKHGCEIDSVAHLISHLFDLHLWSAAQIADWVRTIEPQEPAATSAPEPTHENAPVHIRIAS